MKPRLPSVPLTSEDYDIFSYGARAVLTHEYAQLAFRLDRMSEAQDRRDAELMLGLLTHKPDRAGSLVNVLRALHYGYTGELLK